MTGETKDASNGIAPQIDAQGREDWTPEFSGQRPPFEKGNEAALTHGAHSKRRIEGIAKKINDELLERFPVAREYPETLTALARVEGITRMLFADLATNGLYNKNAEFKSSQISRYLTAENTGAKLRASLGMTPMSEAEVARDRAVAAHATVDVVSELMKQGRATRAQQIVDHPALPSEAVTNRNAKEGA